MRKLWGGVLGLVLVGRFAHAAPPSAAAKLAAEASELATAGDFEGAAGKFRAAYRAEPDPSYLCNVGVAYQRAAQLAKAQVYLSECLEHREKIAPKFVGIVSEALATDEAELRKRDFAEIDIRVVPADAQFHVDGFADDELFAAPRVIWLAFGAHTIRVTATGYRPAERELAVSTRDAQQIQLELEREPPSIASVPTPTPPVALPAPGSRRGSFAPTIIAGVATVAVAATALIVYAHAASLDDDAASIHTQPAFDNKLHSASSWQHASWGLGAAAGVGAVVTGYLFVRAHRTIEVAPVAGGATLSIAGRW